MAKESFPNQLFNVGDEYKRSDIDLRLTTTKVGREGVKNFSNGLVLFVTLEKSDKPENHQYRDFFKNRKEFFWESQGPDAPFGTPEKPIISKMLYGEIDTFLFARIKEKTRSKTNPYVYCGQLIVESFDDLANGERPFGVKFITQEISKNIPDKIIPLIKWKPDTETSQIQTELVASSSYIRKRLISKNEKGQGIIPNEKQRKAIELCAMEEATKYYKSQGYTVFDVSNQRGIGYDLKCERPGSTRCVEVKGTKSDGWRVTVTYTEVDAAQENSIDLFIVNKIKLFPDGDDFKAYPGEYRLISPWKPRSSKAILKAIEYHFTPENKDLNN